MANLLFAKDINQAKNFSRLCKERKIRRIYRGIYTDDLRMTIVDVVKKHWMDIVSYIVPDGILSFRTAAELKLIPFEKISIVFIISTYSKTIIVPGLIIKVIKGNHHDYIEQVLPNLARSNTARMLLENLTAVKSPHYKSIKTLDAEKIENYLAKELQLRGEKYLSHLRDEAKEIANVLGYRTAYQKLNKLIGALLSTHADSDILKSHYAKSVVKKEPYDNARIQLFENLIIYLKKQPFKNCHYQYSKISFKNVAFFESYFSNFIEGTEFIIDEAENIVFKGEEINHRHADSHDILSHFTLSDDFSEMSVTPKNAKELLTLLQERHAYLMKERPDKQPGQFKKKQNKAGNTDFVSPENVIGTLCRGFELFELLSDGLEKALFMQFLIAEVHPFDDGNGRLSRIMMNSELVKSDLYKIIVPSVCRDNYLNGLRLASRDGNFHSYCKTMNQMQAYTASIDWSNYSEAREKIEADCANFTSDEGLPFFNRVLRELK
ncbi:MAG: Fic family protein [Gammaproteobacteria bacterium]|nr:Fic family protein [Gammaproteobacteria bacterium]